MSCVTCHVSHVKCHIFLGGQSGEAYWWRVCYQRGLPRLVYDHLHCPLPWFHFVLQVEADQESQFRGLPDINNQVFTFGNEDDQVKVTEYTTHWTVEVKRRVALCLILTILTTGRFF